MFENIMEGFSNLDKFRKTEMSYNFPFTSIVSQGPMKKALLIAIVNDDIRSVLLTGERGTAKTTAALGLQDLMPMIEVVEKCSVPCTKRDVKRKTLCPECSKKDPEEIAYIRKSRPFVEVPLTLSKDRVFGTLDREGVYIPGKISEAMHGMIFLKSIDMFDQDMIKELFEIQKKGEHTLTRDGKSHTFPVDFILIATINTDKAAMNKELMKEFQIRVRATSIVDLEKRIDIVKRVEEFRKDPKLFIEKNMRVDRTLKNKVAGARTRVGHTTAPEKVMDMIKKVCKEKGADADKIELFRNAAIANALLEGRAWASPDDVDDVKGFIFDIE